MKTLMVLFTMLAATLAVAPAQRKAQENDATAILKAMSDFVGSRKTIQLSFDSDIEVITPQLEKIQFTNSGTSTSTGSSGWRWASSPSRANW